MTDQQRVTRPLCVEPFVAFSDFDREALRSLIRSIDSPFKSMLEVGSWLGNGSTRVFIEELSGGRGVLYAVDHWRGNPNVPRHQEIADRYDVFATFQCNVANAGGLDIVKPLMMSSHDAATILKDDLFDLVFIDADHSYSSAIADIRSWWPKVREHGLLCGHDCEARPSEFPMSYLVEHREQDGVIGNDRVPMIHSGTILAVDEAFEGGAHLMSEPSIFARDERCAHSTIWYITKELGAATGLR